MKLNQDSQNVENFEADDVLLIDDFIKTLEAKEKDLSAFSDLVVEIDDSDLDDLSIPEFLKSDNSADKKYDNLPVSSVDTFSDEKGTGKLKNEISLLQDQVSKMEEQRAELFENSRRRQADFDNYKNRTERERSETFRKQLGNLAEQMLPVLDNLHRALDAESCMKGKDSPNFRHFYDGIILVYQQLNEVLSGMGIQRIKSVGETFDPHFHEAVATEVNDNFPPNTITEELLRGYRIDGKVIRPAMVKVSAKK